MSFFRFFMMIAMLISAGMPAAADRAIPAVAPPAFEIEDVVPDAPVEPEDLPGYLGEQKPEFPGMEKPLPPPTPLPPIAP